MVQQQRVKECDEGGALAPSRLVRYAESVTVVIPVREAMIVPSAIVSADLGTPLSGIEASQMVCPWDPIASMDLISILLSLQNCFADAKESARALTFH